MPDLIGNVSVPEVAASGVFPLAPDWGYVRAISPEIAVHRFLSANAKIEQRFYLGNGSRRWTIQKPELTLTEWDSLRTFWEARQGAYQPFTFNAPSDDGTTTTAYTVIFANEPLSAERLAGMVQSVGITLIEIPATAPTYTLSATETRFPSSSLQAALLSQVQELVPLVRIVTKTAGYPVIFLSDRRCTAGTQLYQARLLGWDGIAQSMCTGARNESDQATFTFGNADKVMRDLANDVDLFRARIEFSIFHVGTGIKLDFWAGEIIDWGADAGPEFRVTAADGLYELNLLYPTRTVDRLCWKLYNDGNGCPYATQGALDLVHFPSASAASCDHGYDTPNGCLAHGMKRYYGAIIAEPQAVRIKDNSTGTFGLGRNLITSVSLVADTIYGQTLPEIYTDSDMPVTCLIAAGRDESDFYDALGIIGEGPIVFGSGHKLDGQFHHGYPGSFGLRQATGTDPAGATDFFSLGQSGDQTGGDWRKVFSGASTYKDNFAAGVAFLELRRKDEKGIQLTRLSEHAMEAIVSRGLQGWIWTGAGARSTGTLTNPIWIVVNALLKATGRRFVDAATAEQAFDVAAAVSAAGINDTSVTKLVGSGSETQFKYRGLISDRRPLRDWLADILSNCLGFYTFGFGKLKLGIRINATSLEAFTAGNIIYQSLQLSPLRPSFNHLTINFADAEYQYQANNVAIQDEDHIKRLGYAITTQMNLAGTSDKSPAARIATIRLREELGGATALEQRKSRQARWLTTVLALNVEPGMVVSITDAEMPDGVGKVRVERLRLNDDWSIELEGRTVTDSMYDLLAGGPKVTDVTAAPVPVEFFPPPLRQVWHPNIEPPDINDPLFSSAELTFGLAQEYQSEGDSGQAAYLVVRGKLPVNTYLPNTQPPIINSISTVATGAGLKGGRNYFLAVCAYNAQGFTPPSNIMAIAVPAGTNTNQITISGIQWPAGSYTGFILLAGEDQRTMCVQADNVGALPSSQVLNGLSPSTWNMPSTTQRNVRVKAKRILNAGVFGGTITAIGFNTLTIADSIGRGDNWTGRKLALLSDFSDGSVQVVNFNVTAHNDLTGVFTCTPDPSIVPAGVGDVIVILAQATTFSSTTIGDAKFVNGAYPSGLATAGDGLKGFLVRIWAGTGRGQVRRISSNTSTVLTVDEPWTTTPDATSLFIIEVPGWEFFAESSPVATRLANVPTALKIPVDNIANVAMLVGAFGVDTDEEESPENLSSLRMIWIYGKGGAGFNQEGYHVLPIITGAVTPNLGDGINHAVNADQNFTVNAPIWTGETINAGQRFTLKVLQDATGGRTITWNAIFIGVRDLELDLLGNTYSIFTFVYNGTKWELRSSQLGASIT